MSVATPEMAAS